MNANHALAEWLGEALAPLGPQRFKKMFGGVGVYLDVWFCALLFCGELLLKADAASTTAFEEHGNRRFTYEFNGKKGTMNYCRAPENCLDDGDARRDWTLLALGAAQCSTAALHGRGKK